MWKKIVFLGVMFVALAADAHARIACSTNVIRSPLGATVTGRITVNIKIGPSERFWEVDQQSSGDPVLFIFPESLPGLGEATFPFSYTVEKSPDTLVAIETPDNTTDDCSITLDTINGHTAWIKSLAAGSVGPLTTWAVITSLFPGGGQAGAAIGAVAGAAKAMGDDPPDCTNGIEQPDFSNAPAVDLSLVGFARTVSYIEHNVAYIVALSNAAITAQNRSSCPTR